MAGARCKGTIVVDLVKTLRSRRDRALGLLPPHLQPYLEKRISVSEWFPQDDVFGLMRAVVALMPDSGEAAWRSLGVRYAESHTKGSYGHLLGELRLETLAIRLGALWKTLFDRGELGFRLEEDAGHTTIRDYPSPGPEMCAVLGAYIAETVGRAGLDAASAEHTVCVHRGGETCSWRFLRAAGS